MRKRYIVSSVSVVMVLVSLLCTACGKEKSDYHSWVNANPVIRDTENLDDVSEKNEILESTETTLITDLSNVYEYHEVSELTNALLSDNCDQLADMLWENYCLADKTSLSEDVIGRNPMVFYVSSSDGDDSNLGLSPDSPKKTLDTFSGISNITVLLKCGDVFQMNNSFVAGSGCIYSTYGVGPRPVLDFYCDLDVKFEAVSEYENVWVADLLNYPRIYTGATNKDNCNLGQLVVDGNVNWKRVVISTGISSDFDWAKDLYDRADGSWSTDWVNSKLYVYMNSNPNNSTIRVAPECHGIIGNGISDTTLYGWTIIGAGSHGCNLVDCNNVNIMFCYLNNIGGSIHLSAGIRYGNAIQVWNGGNNIQVSYNYSDWIYDSCYTNQGNNSDYGGDSIHFNYNIGAHAFAGIETWGDYYSTRGFTDLQYCGNILYQMCDVTTPDVYYYPAKSGGLITNGEEIRSYRGGYTYNQMSNLNISRTVDPNQLLVKDNVFWNTNRLLVLFAGEIDYYPGVADNLFYSEVWSGDAYLYRYRDTVDDKLRYLNSINLNNNVEQMHIIGTEYDNSTELTKLQNAMLSILEGEN